MNLDVHLPAIAAGDAQAFAAWLAGAEPTVRRSLRSFAHVVDTEAVLQEALLRVWQVAADFRPDGRDNALLRLAVRIARNHAIDLCRRCRPESDPPDVGFEVELPDPLLRDHILQCRERLPGPPRKAFDARLDGGSDRELARQLGMKLNTFLKNVGRARQALADCLRRRGVVLEAP